ncbi:MAG TPA: FAD-dependent oxidoreductase, partial [Chromatiales bacterium]|nr:FAD-dependent oxidoreductase [Chromatiales bacterium]
MEVRHNFDCLVVGGGLIGMLTARELAGAGLRIAIVEAGTAGRESTWAGGGILSPLYPWRYPEGVNLLARWSQDRYPELAARLEAESGIDPEFVRNGLSILDADERDIALAWSARWQRQLEVVAGEEIRRLEPRLGGVSDTALWLPEVGQLRNPRLARALRKSVEQQEVEIFEQSPVTGLVTRGAAVRGVTTARATFRAGRVVIAAGA